MADFCARKVGLEFHFSQIIVGARLEKKPVVLSTRLQHKVSRRPCVGTFVPTVYGSLLIRNDIERIALLRDPVIVYVPYD